MAKRKALTKSVRFEVFKRDSFKCQYCGRSAPDVILEVDHIVPVAKGGGNDLLNLITSCRDCNSGKSDKMLSDKSAVEKQKRQLDDLNAMREQAEMLVEWKQELLMMTDSQIDAIDSLITQLSGYGMNETGRKNMRVYLKRFGFSDVYDATEIAYSTYHWDWELAFKKIGGICYNKKKRRGGEPDAEQDH